MKHLRVAVLLKMQCQFIQKVSGTLHVRETKSLENCDFICIQIYLKSTKHSSSSIPNPIQPSVSILQLLKNESRYLRMDQVKFVEDSL